MQFSEEDLNLFSTASHDQNPLHLSDDYAHCTAFGQRVVFGVLVALTGISSVPEARSRMLKRISVTFPNPAFLGIPYQSAVRQFGPDSAEVDVIDGSRLLCKVKIEYQPLSIIEQTSDDSPTHLLEPLNWNDDDLQEGHRVEGVYLPVLHSLKVLSREMALDRAGIHPQQAAALLWCSYLIGMHIPGLRAVFTRMVLEFDGFCPETLQPLSYQCVIAAAKYSMLNLEASLSIGSRSFATVRLQSFARTQSSSVKEEEECSALLSGKTALVIGGSRGLGASFVRSLARQSCRVYATYKQSRQATESVSSNMGEGIAAPIWVATDGASLENCEELSGQLRTEGSNIDFLVCNAWPSLTPLWIDPASCSRIVDYVALGTSLVAVPLSVFMKNMAPGGKIVVVSSSAVVQAPANWPHYVAAKCAVEGLTRVAALEHRDNSFAIVRPPRLATDMTDLPSGHLGALSPAKVASKVLDWLAGPGRPGSVEFIDQF